MLVDIQSLKSANIPVIIFGAGVAGEAVFHACQDSGIKVKCFCDNNSGKTGELLGIPVEYAPEVIRKYSDAIFIIAVIDIQDIVVQLKNAGCKYYFPAAELLRHYDIFRHGYSKPESFVEYVISTCICSQDSYTAPEKLFIRSVDLVITERCSLKCKDCSNLMQYYRKPEDYSLATIFDSVEKLCSLADEINEIRIIGGEPFMNRQWQEIAQKISLFKNINRIMFYTNGTICPKEEDIKKLDREKSFFIITDYGKLSRNIDRMCEILINNGIKFSRVPVGGWTNCAVIKNFKRDDDQNQAVFDCCCVRNSYTLSNGKFYRCPFAANADQLRAVPKFPADYLDLLSENVGKQDLFALIRRRDFIRTCGFCPGRKLDDPQITPAVQTKEPVEYQEYR